MSSSSSSSFTSLSTRRPFLRLSLLGVFFLLFALPWYTDTGCGGPAVTYSGFGFFWHGVADMHEWRSHWPEMLAVNFGAGAMLAGALAPLCARFALPFASHARRFVVQLVGALLVVAGSAYFALFMSIGALDTANAHVPLYLAVATLVALYAHAGVTVVKSAVDWRRAAFLARTPRAVPPPRQRAARGTSALSS